MDKSSDQTTHFGYRDVPVQEKTHLVHQVFESVADNYDLMNDLMSLGVHRLWKRYFVATSGLGRGDRVLDLAGGTGDISALLCRRVGSTGQVLLSDINTAMLRLGRQRMEDQGLVGNIAYALANAEALPFCSGYFDGVTIAFGLRNVTNQAQALREMHRVLKPGGKVRILEFSRVQPKLLGKLYDGYSFGVLPALGRLVAQDADSYQYLAESIRRHPPQEELAEMMRTAGFAAVRYQNLTGGVVAIHGGYRA
jgi:demethylmenaquinone methyltransferase/2-methoxy-6-polyprenyl-1,4-benzoquinol methylase